MDTWRKIPAGQEQEWAELFDWLVQNKFVRDTQLKAAGVDSLAREPQGVVKVGGVRVDTRPDPQKVVDALYRRRVLDEHDLAELRRYCERPLKNPSAIRRVLAAKISK